MKGRRGLQSELTFQPGLAGQSGLQIAPMFPKHALQEEEIDEADSMEHFARARRLMTVVEFSELVARVLEVKESS